MVDLHTISVNAAKKERKRRVGGGCYGSESYLSSVSDGAEDTSTCGSVRDSECEGNSRRGSVRGEGGGRGRREISKTAAKSLQLYTEHSKMERRKEERREVRNVPPHVAW